MSSSGSGNADQSISDGSEARSRDDEEEEEAVNQVCSHVWYGNRDSSDVVIHLVAKKSSVLVYVKNSKRKRDEDGDCEVLRQTLDPRLDHKPLLALHVHSHRLFDLCSKYFGNSATELRAKQVGNPKTTAVEVSVEAVAEISYYKHCFSSMYAELRPIPSVHYSIEILKVATQIQYESLVKLCVRQLSAVPWSDTEEQMIREHTQTAEFPRDEATELLARLEPLMPTKERCEVLSGRILGTMVHYLTKSIAVDNTSTTYKSRFQVVFHEIMSGSCYSLRGGALSHVRQGAQRLLRSAEQPSDRDSNGKAFKALCDFLWLFNVCKAEYAAQFLVEDIVGNRGFSKSLLALKSRSCGYCRRYEPDWTKMILSIFEGVLNGCYFLTLDSRVTLFEDWQWLLLDAVRKDQNQFRSRVRFIIDNFITSFPYEQQEKVFRDWIMSSRGDKIGLLEFERANNKWITDSLKNVVRSEKG